MKPVFADTFYWIALTNPKDSDHQRVMGSDRALGSRVIVSTDEVLTDPFSFVFSDLTKLRVSRTI